MACTGRNYTRTISVVFFPRWACDTERMKRDRASAIRRLMTLHHRFQDLHVKGMAALKGRDFVTLTRVIADERRIIEEKGDLIAEYWPAKAPTAKRRPDYPPSTRKAR